MIAELQIEKHRLDEAIEALERLSSANHPRRSRPARWAKDEQNSADAPISGGEGSSSDVTEDIEAGAIES